MLKFFAVCVLASSLSLFSPDGRVRMTVNPGEALSYDLAVDGSAIMEDSHIAMTLDTGVELGAGKPRSVNRSSVDNMLPSPYYRKAAVQDKYNELRLRYGGYDIVFRAYDDAVAWRFEIGRRNGYAVLSETAEFNFVEDFPMYASYTHKYDDGTLDAQFCDDFENVYSHTSISLWNSSHMANPPLMVECNNGIKTVICEANQVDYPGLFLYHSEGTKIFGRFAPVPVSYKIGGHNGLQQMVASRGDRIAVCDGQARTYPWRVVCISHNDGDMADNDAVWRLADPCADLSRYASWVKPGKVAWDWLNNWNIRGVDFEPGINTESYKYFIDFAARHNIEYILLDEGWAEVGRNDLFAIVPDINLEEIVAYADQKGVGVFLWAGFYPLMISLDKVCEHYAAMGIKGFKVDFMDRNDQAMESDILQIIRTTAAHELMVDLHGYHQPCGLQRTYPNLVNQEGIFGMEQLRKMDLPEYDMVTFDVTIPYVRLVAGFADYTPGIMRNATYENFRPVKTEVMSQGTRCHQLAEYVVFDAPLNMLSDGPTNYENEADCLEFIAQVPTYWDETRILDGKVGEYIITARRKGDVWYVGGLTDWNQRDLEMDLSVLTNGTWDADCWIDGMAAHKFASDFRRKHVSGDGKIQVHLAPGGGFAMIVKGL